MLAVWTMTWPVTEGFDWRAWTVRALAVFVSLLAVPAVEDISGPVREQYILRVVLIGVVIFVALLSGFWRPKGAWQRLPWLFITALGLISALLPSWLYLQVQPFLSDILGVPVSAGIGLWLNVLGNALIVITSLIQVTNISAGEN
jgi:hypothetical protein